MKLESLLNSRYCFYTNTQFLAFIAFINIGLRVRDRLFPQFVYATIEASMTSQHNFFFISHLCRASA